LIFALDKYRSISSLVLSLHCPWQSAIASALTCGRLFADHFCQTSTCGNRLTFR